MPKFIDCISEHYRNSGISSEWGINEFEIPTAKALLSSYSAYESD